MSAPDVVNGLFEFFGGALLWMNVAALRRDRTLRGVRVAPTALFAAWGVWNLYYYPHLGQWWSFVGGLSVAAANAVWVALAIRYRVR